GTSAVHRTACMACLQNTQGIVSSPDQGNSGPVWVGITKYNNSNRTPINLFLSFYMANKLLLSVFLFF
ncbi:hypothetical protein, partial [Ralstonia pseudosolanacearum]